MTPHQPKQHYETPEEFIIRAVSWIAARIEQDILPELRMIKERLTNMDARIQKAIDDIAANKSVSDSAEAGVALILTQVTDLKKQVSDLQAQLATGTSVTEADLSALATATTTLEDTTTKLGTAIPAST